MGSFVSFSHPVTHTTILLKQFRVHTYTPHWLEVDILKFCIMHTIWMATAWNIATYQYNGPWMDVGRDETSWCKTKMSRIAYEQLSRFVFSEEAWNCVFAYICFKLEPQILIVPVLSINWCTCLAEVYFIQTIHKNRLEIKIVQ